MPPRVSADRWAEADQLIAAGKSNHEINRATGISRPAIAKRRGRGDHATTPGKATPDPTPGGTPSSSTPPAGKRQRDPEPRGRRRTVHAPPSDEQLEAFYRKVAKFPAAPAKLILRCDYCATHFMVSAPTVAHELVELSQDDKDLREILEAVYLGWRKYAWASMLVAYAGVPVLHHVAPGPIYSAIAPIVGMPPRHAPVAHAHPDRPAEPTPPVPPATNGTGSPFANLDVDQLLATAKQFGIELPDGLDRDTIASMMTGVNGADTETAPVSEDDTPADPDTAEISADGLAAEVEAAEPDPLAE